MARRQYAVYLLRSATGTLYVGMTNDLVRRVWQHQAGKGSKFTAKYKVTQLVYYEITGDVRGAIAREKEIKGWRRSKKVALVEARNPNWEDLSAAWTSRHEPARHDRQETSGDSSLRSE